VAAVQPEGRDGSEKKKDRKEEARRPKDEEEDDAAEVEKVAVRFPVSLGMDKTARGPP
jgi:hypothetical protein